MKTLAARSALSGCLLLACLAVTQSAQAQTTYDMSAATLATGPAGTIGTHVWRNSPAFSTWMDLTLSVSQAGNGCQQTGCADNLQGGITAEQGGSLRFDVQNAPVGDVKGLAPGPGGFMVEVDRKAFILGTGNGGVTLYTDLVDPARTSFSFTFSGNSAQAGQGVQVRLEMAELENFSNKLFSQSVTSNEAGEWQLVVNTPMGLNIMGHRLGFSISAASGANTVSSLLVTPHLNAVPEPGTWALMGLGLVGLAGVGRSRRPS